MELLAEGWSMSAAAREVGVSRSAANTWKNGTTVRRKDGTVKIVPPLEPLSVRLISPRFLSEEERVQIADLASRGMGPTAIGTILGRAPSTISRELRNLHSSGQYRPFHAHATAASRRRRTRPLKLTADPVLRSYVVARLRERWSPQQISRALRRTHPEEPARRAATETIYQAIYRPATGVLRKPAPSPLRTGRDHRRGHTRQIRAVRRFAQPMLSVHQRGFEPTDRSEAGHWEGDLIVGPHNRSAIGTLVERQTRYVKLLHLPAFNSIEMHAALVRALRGLPAPLARVAGPSVRGRAAGVPTSRIRIAASAPRRLTTPPPCELDHIGTSPASRESRGQKTPRTAVSGHHRALALVIADERIVGL